MPSAPKVPWQGVLTAIQPRIRLTRSFDERQHSYPGYTLAMAGWLGDEVYTEDDRVDEDATSHRGEDE